VIRYKKDLVGKGAADFHTKLYVIYGKKGGGGDRGEN
jgi:hypothetical protein